MGNIWKIPKLNGGSLWQKILDKSGRVSTGGYTYTQSRICVGVVIPVPDLRYPQGLHVFLRCKNRVIYSKTWPLKRPETPDVVDVPSGFHMFIWNITMFYGYINKLNSYFQ